MRTDATKSGGRRRGAPASRGRPPPLAARPGECPAARAADPGGPGRPAPAGAPRGAAPRPRAHRPAPPRRPGSRGPGARAQRRRVCTMCNAPARGSGRGRPKPPPLRAPPPPTTHLSALPQSDPAKVTGPKSLPAASAGRADLYLPPGRARFAVPRPFHLFLSLSEKEKERGKKKKKRKQAAPSPSPGDTATSPGHLWQTRSRRRACGGLGHLPEARRFVLETALPSPFPDGGGSRARQSGRE